jgi:hypothetical protein
VDEVNKSSGPDDAGRADFLDFPTEATTAGFAFFRQHATDMYLMSSERMLVSQLEHIVEWVSRAISPEEEPRDAFPNLYSYVDAAQASVTHNNRAVRTFSMVRYVDNYLVYIADMIALLLRSRPESLRSSEMVTLADVLAHESREDLIQWLVEDRVNRLTFKGFGEISQFVENRFGLPLVEDEKLRRELVHSIAKRNLLVHRRGIADQRFMEALRIEGVDVSGYTLGSFAGGQGNVTVLRSVLASVRDIEARFVSKFGLPVVPLTPDEWWPRLGETPAPGAALESPYPATNAEPS